MRTVFYACLCVMLLACDSPSPRFAGITPVEVVVDGSTFSVRSRDGEAEAIRLNFEPGVRDGPTKVKAVTAIEQATGCAAVPFTVEGDTNVVRATLRC